MNYTITPEYIIVYVKHQEERDLLKSCGGIWFSKQLKGYLAPYSKSFMDAFIANFSLQGDAELNQEYTKRINDYIHYIKVLNYCKYLRDNPSVPTPVDGLEFKTEPMRHQYISLYALLSIPWFGLFLGTGTGKTKTIIDALVTRMAEGKVKRTLVVCPKINIKNTWVPEIAMHSCVDLPITVLDGNKKQKIKLFEDAAKQELMVYVCTYDCMRDYKDHFAALDFVVFDESRRLGDPTTKRTIAATAITKGVPYVVLATGTPNTKADVKDVFSQYTVLDRGATFGLHHFSFLDEYFKDVGRNFPNWVLRRGSLDLIQKRMYQKAISFTKEECLDLPGRTFIDIKIDATEEQTFLSRVVLEGILTTDTKSRATFDAMMEKSKVDSDEELKKICNALPIAKQTKLQEITSGYYKPFSILKGDKTIVELVPAKIEALVEVLSQLGDEKVLLWVKFKHDINTIAKHLKKNKIGYHLLTAKVDEVDKWKASKNNSVLLGSEALGIGLTLVEATYSIYYSYSYSLDQMFQSLDRNYRKGTTKAVTCYFLQVRASVDEGILNTLRTSSKISQKLSISHLQKIAKGKAAF